MNEVQQERSLATVSFHCAVLQSDESAEVRLLVFMEGVNFSVTTAIMTVDGGRAMSRYFENHSRGLAVFFALALVCLVASAPVVLSAEISAVGKGDLERSVGNTITNTDCKVDLGIDAKTNCQLELKLVAVYPLELV